MKWVKDAKEGVIVAGGKGQGNSLTQLSNPMGLIVDHLDNVYIADSRNDRVLRWSKGSREGRIVTGGNGEGKQANQFNGLKGLSFDRYGNLYVVDWDNNRVQRFDIDSN
jgi:sugar lactone lactonase YvrE